MHIIPIHPSVTGSLLAPSDSAPAETVGLHGSDAEPLTGRRTFGRYGPSRRTFGRFAPSRRTFGRYNGSRRTFGRYNG